MLHRKLLLLCLFLKCCICKESNQIYHVALNGDGSVNYNWMLDYPSGVATFEIHLPGNFGWFAIGFSDRGDQFPGDYCILWKNLKGKTFLEDTWVDDSGVVHLDRQQDCKHFKLSSRKNITKFTYKRKFDTCDNEDYVIEEGTTHVVWSRGKTHPYKLTGLNISTSNVEDKGMVRVQLLKNIAEESKLPSHVRTLDIFADKVQVPTEETTYWCHVHKLGPEFKKKHHVYRYESHIPKTSEGLVHHMEVFHCVAPADTEIPMYIGNCFAEDRPQSTQVCKRVFGAWAMGAEPLTYPEVTTI